MNVLKAGKKFFLLLGVLLILLICSGIVADAASDVRIQVDGKIIQTDADPIIENGRTIVPVATIIENIGGTSFWNQENSQVTLEYNGTVVKMWIGSKKATVNGVSKTLDVAPRIVTINAAGGGRTMVPIRFVAENFDCDVDWDNDQRIVLIETADDGVPSLRLEYTSIYTGQKYGSDTSKTYTLVKFRTNQVIKNKGYKAVCITGPDRCYVDVPDSIIDTDASKTKTVSSSKSYVKSVRTGAPTVYNSRVVVDLKAASKPQISYSDDGKTMILAFPETYTGSSTDDPVVDVPDIGDEGGEDEEEVIVFPPFEPYADGKLVVCIDPGHGKTTGGKRSPDETLMEWEFNRDVAYRLKSKLEKAGIKVIMTVAKDDMTDPSLPERVAVANEAGDVDLFVSIHANAFGNGEDWTTPNGWEVYHREGYEAAQEAAEAVRKATKSTIKEIRDRGVKVNDYHVLVNTKMPAILIEHGFFTNKTEVEYLKSDSFREKFASADAQGIINFFNSYK